jgi:hypothetical protein
MLYDCRQAADIIQDQHDFEILVIMVLFELQLIEMVFIIVEVQTEFQWELKDVIIQHLILYELQ